MPSSYPFCRGPNLYHGWHWQPLSLAFAGGGRCFHKHASGHYGTRIRFGGDEFPARILEPGRADRQIPGLESGNRDRASPHASCAFAHPVKMLTAPVPQRYEKARRNLTPKLGQASLPLFDTRAEIPARALRGMGPGGLVSISSIQLSTLD
jgi:hypothetical protein